jgi:hypothetical protein
MNRSRLSALLTLPAIVALAACSSSTAGTGTHSGGASSSQAGASTSASGSTSSAPAGGTPTDAQGLGALLSSGVAHIQSAHIALAVNFSGQAITGSGDEKLANGKVQAMQITESLPGGAGDIQLIVVNGKTYAKLPASLNKTGKPYVLVTENSTDPTIKQLASSIDSSLSSASLGSVGAFVTAASSVKLDGKQSVAGTPATHYSVVVDPSKLPSDYPGKSSLAQAGITSIPVELYVDDQGRPVQVTENLKVQGQSASTKITVSKYNQPVSISAPPASQVGTG